MWNIIIYDQDVRFAEQIARDLYNFYMTRSFETNIQIYTNSAPIVNDPEDGLDLILLNTRPNGRMDYTIADQVHLNHPKAHIFFLSDHDEDIYEAINHHPYCYIRKARWKQELDNVLNTLWENIHKGHILQIKLKRRLLALNINDIVYLESSGHYVILHCADSTYRTREKLSYFIEKLQGMYFVQPSKSFLVNCDYIDKFTDIFILKNGEKIVCTKTRYRATIDFYEKYVREMHAEHRF